MTSSFPPPPGPGDDGTRPEFLDSSSGASHLPPPPPYPPGGEPKRGGRRRAVIAGGTALGLVAAAGGAFAVYQLAFATGPQPAEALPASTVGYVGIDLDPSGEQQLEAYDVVEDFPSFGGLGIESKDDLREKFVELVQDEAGLCPDLDFDDDVKPWLGERFGIAAVDVGADLAGNDAGIAPVYVVQLDDADRADDGIGQIKACASGSGDPSRSSDEGPGGWAIEGDWAVIAESTEIAEAVSQAAQDEPLSGDADFQKWTEAAGDTGFLTAYAAPEAGQLIADLAGAFGPGQIECGASSGPFSADPSADPFASSCSELSSGLDAQVGEIQEMAESFEGGAMTVRANDGGLEVEVAASMNLFGLGEMAGSDRGGDGGAPRPDDTAIAMGAGFEDGWFTALVDYYDSISGGLLDLDDGLELLEQQTGLSFPDDAETLAGESAALAIGGDIDWEALETDPAAQPIGVKVKGDTDAITDITDRLLADPEIARELDGDLVVSSDDDHAVAGPSPEWNERLLQDGRLGDSENYRDVVRESEKASQVIFVDFNQGDWLARAFAADDGDPELEANVQHLKALGISSWTEDDVAHGVLRVTVD
ncbi:hypothetical protein ABFT23_14240 [Nocardioides sp. C4-1]|uniref:hypothetical protein n=1 Tax=Nocardioides sp. C4-1 TaxID=3151851 RepID=UPI003263DCA2